MDKYKITDNGIDNLLTYKNANYVSVVEKILSILKCGIGYSADAIFQSVQVDSAVKVRNLTLGAVINQLNNLETNGYVTKYNDDSIIKGGGYFVGK